ncbi:beta-ribofuranosylaminobenzene 5'-phosphate synthase [Natrinema sp. LN54]|uniref:beta-ribofuranosylaminobenzene 5'-phosphate synthase n=1 Tax=Natrinema sp. LN54 TaxID=3458705 RepID=UPI0040370BC3
MKIETVSRLHFGLIDMNGELGRIDGGIGLALNSPSITLNVNKSRNFCVNGPLSNRIKEGAKAVQKYLNGSPVSIEIEEAIPQHVGLGSGTQAAIAGGIAVSELNDAELSINTIAKITGRGGTSGIGTAAFEGGGFILDGGHSSEEKGNFLPSSNSPASPPPVTSRLDFPDWEIALILPKGEGAHGSKEVSIFDEFCPIPEKEVEKVARIILMKLLPSILEGDFNAFRDSTKKIQRWGFKRREISLQPTSERIIKNMEEKGYAAGMSSLGPTVYAIHPENVDTSNIDHRVYKTKPDNSGVKIFK